MDASQNPPLRLQLLSEAFLQVPCSVTAVSKSQIHQKHSPFMVILTLGMNQKSHGAIW